MGLFRSALASLSGKPRATDEGARHATEAATESGAPSARAPRALADAGRLVEAIALCDGAPSLGTLVGPSVDLAYVLRCWGRHVEAARAIDRALAAADDDPDALSLGALIAVDRRDPAQAERLLRKLGVLRAPTRSDTFAWAAVFSGSGRHDEAAEVLKNLPAAADDAGLALISIQCDLARGRPDEAERRCRDILARHPDHALALANLAVACSMRDRREEARALNARAVEVDGGHAKVSEARTNLAIAEFDLGHVEVASNMLEASLPDHPDINGMLALGPALLAQKQFVAGWRMYEYRWLVEPLASIRSRLGIPQWRGQALDGETVLVRSEQGIGDVVQFARYLPLLKARGAKVHFQPLRDMDRFAERFPGVDHIVREGERLADPTYYVNLLSLPLAFGTTIDTVPSEVPYLAPAPEFSKRWASHFAGRSKPLVGLAWAGRPEHRRDRHRSLALQQLAPILRVPGVRFVSLQKGPAASQPRPIVTDIDWEDVGQLSKELDDALAIVNELDLLICVDTALAHIAGALGKPAWVLNARPADFRWLLDRDDSPWYPTMRLFRQAVPGEWSPVIERVAKELADWSSRPVAARREPRAAVPPSRPPRDDVAGISALPFPSETRAELIEYYPFGGDVGQGIDAYGEWQQQAVDCLATFLHVGDTVICAGAGCGINALQIAPALGPSGHVLASENDSRLYRLLSRNAARATPPNVTALGSRAGASELRGKVGDATLDELRVERLAALFAALPADAMALVEGGVQTLWRDRPILSLECPSPESVAPWSERLNDLGYRCLVLDRPLHNADNFNRRPADVFNGRRYTYLFGVPEERNVPEASMRYLEPDA